MLAIIFCYNYWWCTFIGVMYKKNAHIRVHTHIYTYINMIYYTCGVCMLTFTIAIKHLRADIYICTSSPKAYLTMCWESCWPFDHVLKRPQAPTEFKTSIHLHIESYIHTWYTDIHVQLLWCAYLSHMYTHRMFTWQTRARMNAHDTHVCMRMIRTCVCAWYARVH